MDPTDLLQVSKCLLSLFEFACLSRLQGESLPCKLNYLRAPRKAIGFQFVQLFLLRMEVITSKLDMLRGISRNSSPGFLCSILVGVERGSVS